MKKKLIFLLVLIIGFGIFLAVRFFILDKENDVGRIKILASPAATVFIDNVAMGKTPYENKLKEGEYVIKLIPEGSGGDIASWQGKVRVYNHALTYVNRELGSSDITSAGEIFSVIPLEKDRKKNGLGEIYVETEPAGAIVYLDNDEKGVSPLLLTDVPKGDHEVSVFMPGFFRRTHKINVDSGFKTNAVIKLAVDETQKNIEELQKENQDKKASESAQLKETEDTKSTETESSGTTVVIDETETGWLRVRSEPGLSGEEITRVNAGEEYEVIEESDGWYKIKTDDGKEGWISSEYATEQ